MERDERRGDDRPGARHGWRTPGDASERAERPVQERASLLHDRSMRAWSCLVAVAALVVGCSTGPGPIAPTDAGIASPVPPLAPARVEPTCPDGWLPSALSLGGAACVPWVEAPRCGDGQLLVAGRGCVPLATHCDDEFAADAPPDAVYVRPTGAGGDGTRAHPYATIAEALRTGAHVVALSAGEHRSADLQLEGVTLLGACSDTTTLRLQATLIAHTGTTRIARLRVRGAQPPDRFWSSMSVHAGATLELEEVELASGISRAVQIDAGGSLVASRVAARDLSELFLAAIDPVRITLDHVGVERATGGAFAIGQTSLFASGTLTATDVVATAIALGADPDAPDRGVWMAGGLEQVELTRVVVDGSSQPGVLLRGGRLALTDVTVRDVRTMALGVLESQAELTRVVVDDARSAGIFVASATVRATDLTVRRTDDAIVVFSSDATFARVAVEETTGGAIQCQASTVALSDVSVDGVTSNRTGGGFAIQSRESASVHAERVDVHGASYAALGVFDSELTLDDVRIEDTAAVGGSGGYAIANRAGMLAARRLAIARATSVGLLAIDGTTSLSDVRIEDTQTSDAFYGVGLLVQTGDLASASSTLERGFVGGSRVWGTWVVGAGARLDATDLVVDGTLAAACDDPSCVGMGGGSNLVVASGAALTLDRFASSHADSAGALLGADVTVSLSNGTLALNAIGMVLEPGLPVNTSATPGLALHGVSLEGNGIDQQTTTIEVMAPTPDVDPGTVRMFGASLLAP